MFDVIFTHLDYVFECNIGFIGVFFSRTVGIFTATISLATSISIRLTIYFIINSFGWHTK